MVDYQREITFGYFLVPEVETPLLATAMEVERRGLEYIAVQDHPYQRRYVDTWTLLSMIAARTQRVRVFPDVANLPLRPPAVLAKAAASLDEDLRLELPFREVVQAAVAEDLEVGGAARDPQPPPGMHRFGPIISGCNTINRTL